jgi:hypothetical protein
MAIWNIDNPAVSQILAEHQRLFHFLIELQRIFIPTPPESELEKTRDAVVPKLRELRATLEEHFQREEAGGYLEDAACKFPSVGKLVDRIIQEHPVLLTRLDGILETLSSPQITFPQWQIAHSQFAAYMKQQREHEHRENEIIQQGFNEDLGALME